MEEPDEEDGDADDELVGELEELPIYGSNQHECNDDCDCDAIDDVEYGGVDLMKYESWGDCHICGSIEGLLPVCGSCARETDK